MAGVVTRVPQQVLLSVNCILKCRSVPLYTYLNLTSFACTECEAVFYALCLLERKPRAVDLSPGSLKPGYMHLLECGETTCSSYTSQSSLCALTTVHHVHGSAQRTVKM